MYQYNNNHINRMDRATDLPGVSGSTLKVIFSRERFGFDSDERSDIEVSEVCEVCEHCKGSEVVQVGEDEFQVCPCVQDQELAHKSEEWFPDQSF